MAIPDYQTIMLPLLSYNSDGKEHGLRETIEALADRFKLSEPERNELLPSGQQAIFDNRVAWARTYLIKAGLLQSTRRGFFQITSRGQGVLNEKIDRIDVKYLEKFEEFKEFRQRTPKDTAQENEGIDSRQTPEEVLEQAYQKIRHDLADQILKRVMESSPSFFERMVVELLVKMGYGGSRKDAGQAIGQTGDGGIDGIIKEDKLGLDIIYIQAKRWQNTIGRPEVQKFAGALQGQRARKGVFITTSTFTNDARQYAANIENKLILIDGLQLAQLMIENDVGVSTSARYEIKKIDSDYFSEE